MVGNQFGAGGVIAGSAALYQLGFVGADVAPPEGSCVLHRSAGQCACHGQFTTGGGSIGPRVLELEPAAVEKFRPGPSCYHRGVASGWGWPLALGASLMLAVGTALAVVSVRNEREYERLVLAGDGALSAADLSAAIEAYTGAITLRADSMAAHLKRGLAYRQRGEPEAALRDLRRAAELDPTAPRVFEWQGDVNAGLGRHARAAERYEQSLALDDRQAEVFYKLAVARYREGRAGAAIDPLRRAVALAPALAEAHYLLGISLRDAGRLDEAFAALNSAARLSPGLLEAREARVDVLQARGDVARAVDELAALAALEPERPERAVAVGAAYARAGRHDAAVLSERFPESSAVFGALGAVWLRAAETGDAVALEKAIAALTRGATLADPSGETLMLLGRARVLSGDLPGAERELRRAIEQLPTPPDAYARLADVLERGGRPVDARNALVDYATLVAGTPAVGAVAPRVGALSMRIGDPHAAAYWYEKAIAEAGGSAALFHRWAEAEIDRGATNRAREVVDSGLALEPTHAGLLAIARTLDAARAP
jgi:tetratricopeptide (TPR) repeat protein